MIWRHEAAKMLDDGKSNAQIAKKLGLNKRTVERWRSKYQKGRASPLTVTGKSTLSRVDEDGKKTAILVWDKENLSKADIAEQVRAFIQSLIEPIRGAASLTASPVEYFQDLLNIIPYGDPHVGLYAWAKEAGDDYDLKIAEDLMISVTEALLRRAPKAAECWIINLGDFFHADSQANATPASGHLLDVDSRWPKIQQAGARIMRRIIQIALERHERVVVKCVRGNHDPHAGYTLAMILAAYYESEPRVVVDLDPGAFWYRTWGRNLFGVCHGHTVKKVDDLPSIMAADCPVEWGAARHRRWLLGHFHNSSMKEHRGCSVEIFRTLAPADAWTQASGYRSDRSLSMLTVHRDHGITSRAEQFFDSFEEMERVA